jgi:NhaC family Na+:H+ antiporter
MPPIPTLMISALLGGLFAIIFQPHIIKQISGITDNFAKASYIGVMQAMYGDIQISTGNAVVDDLFHTSGMSGMLLTIWLIL